MQGRPSAGGNLQYKPAAQRILHLEEAAALHARASLRMTRMRPGHGCIPCMVAWLSTHLSNFASLGIWVGAHVRVRVVDGIRGEALEPVLVHPQARHHQAIGEELPLQWFTAHSDARLNVTKKSILALDELQPRTVSLKARISPS